MWAANLEALSTHRGLKVTLEHDAKPATLAHVMRGWQTDTQFRDYFNSLLADAPYSALRWELPAATVATIDRPFECVLLDSPGLATRPDPSPFSEHLHTAAGSEVVEFSNLGNDAILIVPTAQGASSAYGHVAAFAREAPESQRHQLWAQVGDTFERRLNAKPVWLSTAGGGVAWLHVRLDDRPKYYSYEPYRKSS